MSETLPNEVDVVVVGAGPAGCAVAGLLSKYRPETRVLVLEKEQFPRYKIGESLIVDANRILHDLDALDEVGRAGFVPKYGVSFVWGQKREPKTFLFGEGGAIARKPEGYQLDYTYHVDRPRFDRILADTVRRHGAKVVHGYEVVDVVRDNDRVTGVTVRKDGATSEVRAKYVVDAGGGAGPLTRHRFTGKQLDDDLRNIAVYGYYKNLDFVPEWSGDGEHRRTLLVMAPAGWAWIIPLSNGVTSVGFVTSLAAYKESGLTPEEFHHASLKSLPEYARIFGRAELVDYRGEARRIFAVQEYSFSCERTHGPGWAVVGDSSGFVDAILSIGCFVAMNHGQFLAYTLASVLDGACDEKQAFECYSATVNENLRAFRGVAHMFYAFNPDMTEWWKECAKRLRASAFVPAEGDRRAFAAYFTGFAARANLYEDALHAFDGQFLVAVSEELFSKENPFAHERIGTHLERSQRIADGDPVLRIVEEYTVRPWLLPRSGSGRLQRAARFELKTASETGLPRRLILPEAQARLPGLIDGKRKLSQVLAAYEAEVPQADRAEALRTLRRLAAMGALA